MSDRLHDTLVHRLSTMLIKLNQGESLEPSALAAEFGVNVRTIQRDLNERFASLRLEKTDGRYRVQPALLGKLSPRDIEHFATLAGVQGLFPAPTQDILRYLTDTRSNGPVLVKGHNYEDISAKAPEFKKLEGAIVSHLTVSFRYRKGDTEKVHPEVHPYKLLNHKGIWYLAGLSGGKLKTYAFSSIDGLIVSDQPFEPDTSISTRLENEDGIWLGQDSFEVLLEVAPAAAGYFKRRNVIANQQIDKEHSDGRLVVSTRVSHANQILPHVRYWIPHVRIVSPEGLKQQLHDELAAYLK